MLRRYLVVLASVGCQRHDASPLASPLAPPLAMHSPADANVPVDAAIDHAVKHLDVRDQDVLCIRGATTRSCMRLSLEHMSWGTVHKPVADSEGTTFANHCTVDFRDELACPGAAPVPGFVATWTQEFGYVKGPGRLDWFELDSRHDDRAVLHAMPAFADRVRQLSAAYRAACVLTTDDGVWCWSDPRAPRRVSTPKGVVDIFVQDLFVLCVRTDAGEVWCTPPHSPDVITACAARSIECGTGGAEDVPLERRPFRGSFSDDHSEVRFAAPRSRRYTRSCPRFGHGGRLSDIFASNCRKCRHDSVAGNLLRLGHAPAPGATSSVLLDHSPLHAAPVLATPRLAHEQRVPLLPDRCGIAV